jgi:hypothetical protein
LEPTATIVRQYISDTSLTGGGKHSYPLFPNRQGERLSRAGIKYILDKCVASARNKNPGVLPEVISPHTFRHSKAMHLLHAGVNLVYIRDILGHADLKTTEIYARIDGEMKRKALEKAFTNTVPSEAVPLWQQDGKLLNWLQSLGKLVRIRRDVMSRKVWASLAAQGHFGSIHFGWSAGYTKAVPPVTLIYQAKRTL